MRSGIIRGICVNEMTMIQQLIFVSSYKNSFKKYFKTNLISTTLSLGIEDQKFLFWFRWKKTIFHSYIEEN